MTVPPMEPRANLPDMPHPFKVMAIYRFADLPDVKELQAPLAAFCCGRGIKGTLILAREGVNGTVAGTPEAIDALHAFLMQGPLFSGRLEGAEIKFSFAHEPPFARMKVRVKDEIVTLRAPQANPALEVGTYVAPRDWNDLVTRQDVVLLDTRNAYEVGLGSFAGARDPGTQNFTQFKDYVARNLDPARDRKVAMFCTGGIRCEKASSYLLSQGFEEVFHLKGGILAYLETVPTEESLWRGECFVFDERVSVGHGLEPGDASLCRACRHPLTTADRAHPDYREGVSCAHCAGDAARHAAAAERQKQVLLAQRRGLAHLGDAVHAAAEEGRERKRVRAEHSRGKAKAAG
ncbi:oxygen-dependent tRNA uridine(34) hydroxylase TrhO [Devosia geojensis]|nr:rhodanese-related sulfurtransferase [Devosia geojensis]